MELNVPQDRRCRQQASRRAGGFRWEGRPPPRPFLKQTTAENDCSISPLHDHTTSYANWQDKKSANLGDEASGGKGYVGRYGGRTAFQFGLQRNSLFRRIMTI